MASSSSASTNHPPGEFAAPDDQGNLGFCSRYAVAKAGANGFMTGKFFPNQILDFVQTEIEIAIVNSDKVE